MLQGALVMTRFCWRITSESMCLTLDSLRETLTSWTFCRITSPGLAHRAASSPGRSPNLRGDCGCPARSSWRCMPSSRDAHGCGSTIHDAALELAPGDLALVRGGPDHHIAHEPAAACLLARAVPGTPCRRRALGDRRATVFLCGAYRFSGDVGRGLLEALPPILPLSAAADDPLHDVIALLSRELAASAPGQQTVLDRLLDVLLVLAIRACFERSANAPRWYQASADPRLSRGIERHARRRRPPVDGARTGRRQRPVTGGLRANLSAGTRSGTDAVPDRLAHDAGARSPAQPAS